MARECKQFNESEAVSLKDIVNSKWEQITSKIDNLANEVFDEVIEHEMALAKLETYDLSNAIPENVQMKQ